LEAEGLITPKLIGMPQTPGNPEMLMEAMIGFRSFSERRFLEISKQIDELRQLMISLTLKQELKGEIASPWTPLEEQFSPMLNLPAPQEISIGSGVGMSGNSRNRSVYEEDPLPIGELTDQNYIDLLGRALDFVGWSDVQADNYSQTTFGIAHWDQLGRGQAESLITVLRAEIRKQEQHEPETVAHQA
jgi:hypothetical protein